MRAALGVLVLGLALCHVVRASTQGATTPYADAIDLFRQGQDELALNKLARIMAAEVTAERDALFKALDGKNKEDSERAAATICGAVMLHTARAFVALTRHNEGEFRYQIALSETYVAKLRSRGRASPFVKQWPLLVLALLHEGRLVRTAKQFGEHARDPSGDSAELLLALGATEEMAWWMNHEDDADVKGDLGDAERHYRQALIVAPTLAEARLRLGRVLVLRNDAEGMKVLGQIGPAAEMPYQYLARLFEGETLEKRGDTVEAERRYSAAVAMMPTAQSAYVALAHVRHARGARAEAAEDVRSSARARDVPDTADPWFWYSRGTAWRGPGYVEEARRMIHP
ncbi:MAG TPA: hypothetical protein VFT39_00960 [Vicinamibacterales bacterium]|nr:hypothetical protein [Vicinamibacterales bacterium]